MVVGLFLITAIPTVTGTSQAISAQKRREQRQKDENRMKKFNIDVEYEGANSKSKEIQHGRVVVKDERVWVGPTSIEQEGTYGYVSECMIVEYPDSERIPIALGLVSQVQSNPPLLNWIYIDTGTLELKYGNKTASIAHHVGSWDWTDDEKYLTLENLYSKPKEHFYAVESQPGQRWQLYCDLHGNGLKGYVPADWTKLPIRLQRALLSKT